MTVAVLIAIHLVVAFMSTSLVVGCFSGASRVGSGS